MGTQCLQKFIFSLVGSTWLNHQLNMGVGKHWQYHFTKCVVMLFRSSAIFSVTCQPFISHIYLTKNQMTRSSETRNNQFAMIYRYLLSKYQVHVKASKQRKNVYLKTKYMTRNRIYVFFRRFI